MNRKEAKQFPEKSNEVKPHGTRRRGRGGRLKRRAWVAKFGLAREREGNRRESGDNGRSVQKKKGAAFNGGKVSEMVLRSGRKRVHSAGSPETSGRTGEESDPEYRSGDEGESQHNGSESSASEEREVPFSHFDVALLTGFPATGKLIAFERSDGGGEVEEVLKRAMEERVCRERQRRTTAQKDMRIYRNYVSVLLELCKVNNTVERVTLFKKLYTFLVVSGLLFPWCTGGVAWDLVHIVEDVDGVREYNWAEAIIPVIEARDDERRMQAVEALIMSDDYSAYVEDAQGVISVDEQLQRASDTLRKEREALAKEKEAHATTKKELVKLKETVAMKIAVEDILEFARIQGLNSTADAPRIPAVYKEETNTDIFTPDMRVQVDRASSSSPVQSSDVAETIAVGESVPSAQLGAHPVDAELVVVGESPGSEERPKSSIAKRVWTRPRPQNPSVMQSSPYLYPDRAAGKVKRKCGNVYTSRKRSKKHGGVSAAYVAGTDRDVGGAPPGKVKRRTSNMSVAIEQVGDESPLGSSENANVEPIVQAVVDKGFPTGELRVDDVDGSVHVRMVAEEGAAKDAKGTAVSRDVTVDYVHNSIDQGATYDGPMMAGVDVVRCETHGTEDETNAGPSTQTCAIVEGAVDEGRDGSGNPSAVTMVVTTSDEDSSPASSDTGHGRQPPRQHLQRLVRSKRKGALEVGQGMPFKEQRTSMAIVPWRYTLEAHIVL
ncbi:hypothetical protein Cgig2_029574 [Carnegiea gigantea]|uniref:Uncharacterized protein n=1 Tax=Carnegiea gigantea TaxID=171969 RepID=A0A9Q1JHI0_9CARY|nr:hypothetical protein Cgig2_029574 [Carnegiea gigantea]